MYPEIRSSLKNDIRFKIVECTHSTNLDSKYIILVTRASKDTATAFIDNIIIKRNAPNTNSNKRLDRSSKYNVKYTLLSYAAMLQ